MIIDTNALLNRVNQFKAAVTDRDCRIVAAKKTSLCNAIMTIKAHVAELKQISQIVKQVGYNKRFDHFFTEGMCHDVGFSKSVRNYFGVCGGGFAGRSVFLNVDTGKWVVCNWNSESSHDADLSDDDLIESQYDSSVAKHIRLMAEGLCNYVENVARTINALPQSVEEL